MFTMAIPGTLTTQPYMASGSVRDVPTELVQPRRCFAPYSTALGPLAYGSDGNIYSGTGTTLQTFPITGGAHPRQLGRVALTEFTFPGGTNRAYLDVSAPTLKPGTLVLLGAGLLSAAFLPRRRVEKLALLHRGMESGTKD